MITDLSLKNKIIACLFAIVTSVFSFLFREPIMAFMTHEILVPIWIFPLVVGLSIASVFLVRWSLLFRDPRLKAYRRIIKPGRQYGINGGYDHVTALEWSWIDPRILVVANKEGHILRVHYSMIIFYL